MHYVVFGEEILFRGERSSLTVSVCLNKLNKQTLYVFMAE